MIHGSNAIYTNAGRKIPPGSHWNIEMSIFGQKNRSFFFLRDNLDPTLRCWKAAEGPSQLIYQLKETKAGCTKLQRGPSHSCGGDGDTPASVSRAEGESEGCAAAEVMHSPFTLPGYRKKSSAHCHTHHGRMIIFRWQYCATWGLNQADWNVWSSRLLVTYSGEQTSKVYT